MSMSQFNSNTSYSHSMPTYSAKLPVPSYSSHILNNSFPFYSTRSFNNSYVGSNLSPTYTSKVRNLNLAQNVSAQAVSSKVGAVTVISSQPIFSQPISSQLLSSQSILAQPVSKQALQIQTNRNISLPTTHSLPEATHVQAPVISPSQNIQVASATTEVPLNQDPNPILIKKPSHPITYTQQVSVKFLKPPSPPPAGDIVITQQNDKQGSPVPPKHIRQQPPVPVKPAPLIIRERPPPAPVPIHPEHHVIPGKVLPPPPRKVITERLPQLPAPPQDIIVERWLEYGPRTRKIVFHPAQKVTQAPNPRNVIIEWDSPNVSLNRQFINLGVSFADPNQYTSKYGPSLVDSSAIPQIALGIRPENGLRLASESISTPIQLIGDVVALKLINRPTGSIANTATLQLQPVIGASIPTIIEETANFKNRPESTFSSLRNFSSHADQLYQEYFSKNSRF